VAKAITVAELFAGVGGFRLGLEGYKDPSDKANNLPKAGTFKTIWANQWEPPGSPTRQFAANCYRTHFGNDSVVNEDINKVLNEHEQGLRDIPSVDMVVGGFPCQDYSVAKPLSQSGGIEGKKGVLWWDIYKFLKIQLDKSPENAEWCLLENVDRLLKSPASQRGRDFAIILSCLASLGYCVEWRVVNSAAYGFSQRRKRVYILARRNADWELSTRLFSGIMSRAFPFNPVGNISYVDIPKDPFVATKDFNSERSKTSPFLDAGVMVDNRVITCKVEEVYKGQFKTLGDVLSPENEVPENYFIDNSQLSRWEYLKGSKREERVNKFTGQTYFYSEGSMAFPDLLTNPSRTILTGEGGASPSRFKHIIKVGERYRRLVPDELDRLQGFPKGWTNTGMSDNNRAFCMGNALVVGVVNRIGKEIYKEL
jgi:DNA (cytosine-5-)-methyltransferase